MKDNTTDDYSYKNKIVSHLSISGNNDNRWPHQKTSILDDVVAHTAHKKLK